MTINEIIARLEQNPNEEERRRLLIEHQELLKSAERVMNWLPEFNPLKELRKIIAKITKKGPNSGL